MAVLLVTYDLKAPGRNYEPLYEALKRYSYCKGLESVWLLDTTVSAEMVREQLRSVVDTNDIIFVTRLSHSWASFNFSCGEWLKDPRRSW